MALIKLGETVEWLLTNRLRGISVEDNLQVIDSILGPATQEMPRPPKGMAVRLHDDVEVAFDGERVFYIQVDLTLAHFHEWRNAPLGGPLPAAICDGHKDVVELALTTSGVAYKALNYPEEGIELASGTRLYWDMDEGRLSSIVSARPG